MLRVELKCILIVAELSVFEYNVSWMISFFLDKLAAAARVRLRCGLKR